MKSERTTPSFSKRFCSKREYDFWAFFWRLFSLFSLNFKSEANNLTSVSEGFRSLLDEDLLKSLLQEKRLTIQEEYAKLGRSREELREAYLRVLPNLSPEEILEILQEENGAVPQEPVRHIIPLGDAFITPIEMKNWAAEVLSAKVVIAVDGSQIITTGEFNIPIGFVQAGAFWTEYTPEKGFYLSLIHI